VRLRPFADGDLDLVAHLASDPYVGLIGTIPIPFTVDEGLAYLVRQHQRLVDGTGYSFAVVESASGRAVGTAGLWLRERDQGRATAGYTIAPSARGRGLAAAALAALTELAWRDEVVQRVELLIEPWNTASVRTAERCGYECEGLLPEHLEIGGQARDMLRYAATRPD
jgi:RimJ/RimL family protein N-acetyltransferase